MITTLWAIIISWMSSQNPLTHIIVDQYSAPNHNHSILPSKFTLWRIDTQIVCAKVDPYFVALVDKN
jgi:hypothetical protein